MSFLPVEIQQGENNYLIAVESKASLFSRSIYKNRKTTARNGATNPTKGTKTLGKESIFINNLSLRELMNTIYNYK